MSSFEAGNTIDSVVDSVNRQLYAPYARGVLVTIANTSLAVYKLDAQIIAFSAAAHADQVPVPTADIPRWILAKFHATDTDTDPNGPARSFAAKKVRVRVVEFS